MQAVALEAAALQASSVDASLTAALPGTSAADATTTPIAYATSATPSPREPLSRTAGRGMILMTGVTLLTRVTGIAQQAALAWLLLPGDYGTYALASTVGFVASAIAKPGLEDFLVQRGRKLRTWENTSFWLSLTLGIIGTAGLILSGVIGAWLYDDVKLFWVLLALSLGALPNALLTVPTCKLSTQLRFARSAWLSALTGLLIPALTIAMAAAGAGVYALVLPTVMVTPLVLYLSWRAAPVHLTWRTQWRRWRYLIQPTALRFGSKSAWLFVANGDYLILGLFASQGVVGMYFFAFNLATQVGRLLGANLLAVMVPSMTSIADDPARQRAAVYSAVRLVAVATVPLAVLMSVMAGPIVRIVAPARWESGIPLVQILCIATMTSAAFMPAGAAILAARRFKEEMLLAFATAAVFGAIVLPCTALFGSMGTASGVLIHAFVTQSLLFPRYLQGGSVMDLARLCGRPVIAAAVAFVPLGLACVRLMRGDSIAVDCARLVITALIGTALYAALIRLSDRRSWDDLVGRVRALR